MPEFPKVLPELPFLLSPILGQLPLSLPPPPPRPHAFKRILVPLVRPGFFSFLLTLYEDEWEHSLPVEVSALLVVTFFFKENKRKVFQESRVHLLYMLSNNVTFSLKRFFFVKLFYSLLKKYRVKFNVKSTFVFVSYKNSNYLNIC